MDKQMDTEFMVMMVRNMGDGGGEMMVVKKGSAKRG